MVRHVLYLEKGNGNVLYHLSEKRVVPVEKQMKRSIFSGTCNCGQMVQKFLSKREEGNTSKGITFFPKTFHRDEPFHLNSTRNYRKFHSNGKRVSREKHRIATRFLSRSVEFFSFSLPKDFFLLLIFP